MVLTAAPEHFRPSPLLPSAISLDNHDLDRGFLLKDLFKPFTKEANYEHWHYTSTVSRQSLITILERNFNTVYFRDCGYKRILQPYFDSEGKVLEDSVNELVDAYRRLPLSSYDSYKPYIDRMYQSGERNLLSSTAPDTFLSTRGHNGSIPKLLPFYKPDNLDEVWYNFPNRQTINTVHALSAFKSFNIRSKGIDLLNKFAEVGYIDNVLKPTVNDIEPLQVKFISNLRERLRVALLFLLCESNLEFIRSVFLKTVSELFQVMEKDWNLLLSIIERGRILNGELDIDANLRECINSMLEPRPSRVLFLRTTLDKNGGFENIVPYLWPKLALIVGAYSCSYMQYRRKCQFYTSRAPFYMESGYLSSEANMALPLGLLPNHHILNLQSNYLEFLPLSSNNETNNYGGTVLPSELQLGREYEPILTSYQSSLMKYRMGDVVRMMGYYNNLPVIQLVRRRLDIITVRGINLYEQDLSRALDQTKLKRKHFYCYEDSTSKPSKLGIFIELNTNNYQSVGYSTKFRVKDVTEANLVEATGSIHRFLESKLINYKKVFGNLDPTTAISIKLVTPNAFNNLVKFNCNRSYDANLNKLLNSKLPLKVTDTDILIALDLEFKKLLF